MRKATQGEGEIEKEDRKAKEKKDRTERRKKIPRQRVTKKKKIQTATVLVSLTKCQGSCTTSIVSVCLRQKIIQRMIPSHTSFLPAKASWKDSGERNACATMRN